MNRALITMADAVAHLRLDEVDTAGNPEDAAYVSLLIEAASGAVLNYLKSGADVFLDSSGEVPVDTAGDPTVPFPVKAATLLMLGYLYRERDGGEASYEHGYLPRPVIAQLYPLRDPALR